MAKIWTETYDSLKHRNPMGSAVGEPPSLVQRGRAPTLQPYRVLFVRVATFTFEFHSREQVEACLAYYRQEHHPSSRSAATAKAAAETPDERWAMERWYERLPMYLLEKPKRARVVSALEKALSDSVSW